MSLWHHKQGNAEKSPWQAVTPEQAAAMICELYDVLLTEKHGSWRAWAAQNWGADAAPIFWSSTAGSALVTLQNACANFAPQPEIKAKKEKPLPGNECAQFIGRMLDLTTGLRIGPSDYRRLKQHLAIMESKSTMDGDAEAAAHE